MTRQAAALAPAKINLGLEVTGRRPDGYHDIVTILQTVTLFDRFEWTATGHPFRYESPAGIPSNEDLVTRVLASCHDQIHWTGHLRLHKAIPVAAGLGGGSSDAALALKLARSPDQALVAQQLGSDIPFFLRGGTCLASGVGSTLEPLTTPDLWFVIVTPPVLIPAKTRTLYGSLGAQDFSDGATIRQIAAALQPDSSIDRQPPNAFEQHLRQHHEVEAAWGAFHAAGAPWVSVSGAGPSLYTAVTSYRAARSIARRIPIEAGKVVVARSLPRRHRDIAAENIADLLRSK